VKALQRQVKASQKSINIFGLSETSSPNGCKRVAGGRSAAKTAGTRGNKISTLEGWKIFAGMSGTLSGCASESLGTGGIRCAPTTGYSLATRRVACQIIRFAGNADARVRSQHKSHSYADEDVRVPSISSVGLKRTTTEHSSPLTQVSQPYNYSPEDLI